MIRLYVPFILANIPDTVKPILDFYGNSFETNLAQGESWEDVVAYNFGLLGIDAYRPCQKFSDRNDYRKLQEDVRIRLNGRELTVDVKARNNPFQYPSFLVGGTRKWDERRYQSLAVVIIDSATGEARVTPADTKTRESWKIKTYNEPSYSVSSKLFHSFDIFIGYLLSCSLKTK